MVKDTKAPEELKRTRRIKKEELSAEESEVENQPTKKTSKTKLVDSVKKSTSKRNRSSSVDSSAVESEDESLKKNLTKSKKSSKPVSSDTEDSDNEVTTKKTSKTNKKASASKPTSAKVQKPLKVDNDGINFSTSRVRGYIQSNVLNSSEVTNAINELKENKEALTKEDTIFTESHLLNSEVRLFLANLAKQENQVRREKLERSGRKTHLDSLDNEEKAKFKEQLKTLGDSPDKISKFYKKLNKTFYTEFNETNPANSVGDTAWKYYYGKLLRGQTKVMNKNATLYLTCFVEEILRQTFSHLCLTSVTAGSKSINLQHMDKAIDNWNDKNFYFDTLVRNLNIWKCTTHWVNNEGYKKRVKGEERVELVLPCLEEYKESKTGFEVYVDHVCKQVKRDFDMSPPKIDYNEGSKDLFGNITISKELKTFGIGLVVELLDLIGQFILLESSSRKVRSINHELMVDIVSLFAVANNLNNKLDDLNSTLQSMYNRTIICLEKRKVENALKPKKNENLKKKGTSKSNKVKSDNEGEDEYDDDDEVETKSSRKSKKTVPIVDSESTSDSECSKKRSSSKFK